MPSPVFQAASAASSSTTVMWFNHVSWAVVKAAPLHPKAPMASVRFIFWR
jgi:hypothetical protein